MGGWGQCTFNALVQILKACIIKREMGAHVSNCMRGVWLEVVWSRHRHHIDNLIQYVTGKCA